MSQPEVPEYGMPQTLPQPQPATRPEEPARLGPVQRFFGVLLSPGETFADINRKPTWLVPLLISMLLALGFAYFFEWRVKPNWEEIVRTQTRKVMERFGQPMPPDEELRKSAARQPLIAKVGAPVRPLFTIFFLSGLYVIGMILMTAQTTYKKILSVLTWSYAGTMLVQIAVLVLSLMLKDEERLQALDPTNPGAFAATNLAAFLPPGTSGALVFAAAGIDVFTIWFLILLVLGFVAISDSKSFTKGKAATLVFGLWVISLFVGAALGALFGG
jgi:hypothetical protein